MINSEVNRIKTFMVRGRKFTSREESLWQEEFPHYAVADINALQEKSSFFKQISLEIGFGDGATLFKLASEHPQVLYIGIEIYRPGILQLLHKLHEHPLPNVALFYGDALQILDQLPEALLDYLWILFPDPWPKRRHHRRRLVQPLIMERLIPHLKSGAIITLATDWPEYAEVMRATLDNLPGFKAVKSQALRPLVTKFEAKGISAERPITDLIYQKL